LTPFPVSGIGVSDQACYLTGGPPVLWTCYFVVYNKDPKYSFQIISISQKALTLNFLPGVPQGDCGPPKILSPSGFCLGWVTTDPPSCPKPGFITIEEIDVQGYFLNPGISQKGSGSIISYNLPGICPPAALGPRSQTPRNVPFRGTPGPNENVVTPIAAAPGQVPTNTATNTPNPRNQSVQQQAVVPTLSFLMLGLLAVALIGAALWVLRGR
jgi:hypothetical protein